jgi:hypothetical protein
MLPQILTALFYSNIGTLLIPLGMGLFRWKTLSGSLRYAWAALFVYLLSMCLTLVTMHKLIVLPTNSPEYIIYVTAILFGLGFAVCYVLAMPPGRARQVIIGLEAVAIAGIGVEMAMQAAESPISQWSVALQTVISTIITLIYLRYLTRHTPHSLLTVPLFWISIARLTSTLLSTLYDALRVPIAESAPDWLLPWMCFQFAISILCNLVYGYGFWKAR